MRCVAATGGRRIIRCLVYAIDAPPFKTRTAALTPRITNAFKRTNMAGVSVGGRFFAFDCEEIILRGEDREELSEEELLPLLHCFSRGEFTRVKKVNLVIPLHCTPHFFFLTHATQNNNNVGDGGAKLIGEGLKVNSSLKELRLVRHFFFVI